MHTHAQGRHMVVGPELLKISLSGVTVLSWGGFRQTKEDAYSKKMTCMPLFQHFPQLNPHPFTPLAPFSGSVLCEVRNPWRRTTAGCCSMRRRRRSTTSKGFLEQCMGYTKPAASCVEMGRGMCQSSAEVQNERHKLLTSYRLNSKCTLLSTHKSPLIVVQGPVPTARMVI